MIHHVETTQCKEDEAQSEGGSDGKHQIAASQPDAESESDGREAGRLMTLKFRLEFGCLCKSISEQLKEVGIELNEDKTKEFNGDLAAINAMKCRHLFSPSQIDAAYGKLAKKVTNHLYSKAQCGGL